MPFSRYQIRNEFSLADPELYKAADKDDPEALLEGVAMAGLVGVLRQLGDLAEFAAEIFHDLHEEVMVTATRGHGLLVRVQQLESDFPSIERAFLSQTGHSAFFSSSGIGWHPNLRMEQNLITRGDLPRFVMDSYEECRGPPRLFLLDKFDVAGAGACLKRYTDPSFYKVEASSYEMMTAEAQRDKKIHKTKKKGSQWKNGKTPEVFQPSHVKLHQLLREERMQNSASEPSRLVKLKKRKSKIPFEMENGKGYMEKLLSSPPEDKLVHEVPVGRSPLRLPTSGPGRETFEISMVEPPRQNRNPNESPSVDKTVSTEHMDNVPKNIPGSPSSELPNLSIRLTAGGSFSGMEEDVEEKHISVENGYQYNDVGSEADDFVDALATMESEIETDVELRPNSDPSIKQETSSDTNVEQLQSHSSGSQSASDDESSSIGKKITSFSYSDTESTSADNIPTHGLDSPQAFATTEIPFRPRVQVSVNYIEASAISTDLPVDQGAIPKESTSKDSDLSETLTNDCVDVNSPKKTEQVPIVPEGIVASTSDLDDPSSTSFVGIDNEDHNSNSTLVISHVEELDGCDAVEKSSEASFSSDSLPKLQLTDDLLECKSDPVEAEVSYSGEVETELKDRETAAVCDPADDGNENNNLPTLEDEKELEKETGSVNSETKDVTAAASVYDDVDIDESKGLSTREDTELDGGEVELIDPETESVSFAVPIPGAVEKNEDNGLSTGDEPDENGFVVNEMEVVQNPNEEKKESGEQSVISSELDPVPSAYFDHSDTQILEREVDSPSAKKDSIESSEKMESSEQSVISPELDSVPPSYDHTYIQNRDNIHTSSPVCGDPNENDDDNPSANSVETLFVSEKTDQNGLLTDVLPDVDLRSGNQFLDSAPNSLVSTEGQAGLVLDDVSTVSSSTRCLEQNVESQSLKQVDHIEKLENASSVLTNSVLIEEKVEETRMPSLGVDSQNVVDHETQVEPHSDPYPVNHGLKQGEEFEGPVESEKPSMVELPQLSSHVEFSDQGEYPSAPVFSGYNMLPELAPINLEEMPPLPPLPPMQWRMGRMQNAPLISGPDDGQDGINHFPSFFPRIGGNPLPDQNENAANNKDEADYKDSEGSSRVLPTGSSLEEDGNLVISSEVKFAEEIIPQPPFSSEKSQKVSTSGREIIRPSSTSSLPPANDERPNGIRPMKVQRPRTPLIDAVAAHDKSKLRKVSERARPPMPKEEERDTLLEQIRAKSFSLKPAVQTRPSIQGPTTNLRVAAILEKANAIRQSLAGSDDDEDEDDGWSDS